MIAIKRISLCAAASLLAAAVAVSGAKAGESQAAKINAFNGLLGSDGQAKKMYWKKNKRRSLFDSWLNDPAEEVRLINGQDLYGSGDQFINGKPGAGFDNIDPEAGESHGMGNLTYTPEKLVALGGSLPSSVRPEGLLEGAIYDAFADAALDLKVLPAEKTSITDAYGATGFKPFWLENGKLTDRARAVLKVLAGAGSEGLDSSAYLPPVLTGFDAADAVAPVDIASLARLDLGLTAMALKYARHASAGQFDPRRLSTYYDVSPEPVSPAVAIKVLGWSPYASSYLEGLQPKLPAYATMKAALAELRKGTPAQEPIEVAEGPGVKPGKADPRIPALRQRLAQLGYDVPPPMALGKDDVLDLDMAATLKLFQKASAMRMTGVLDAATVRALGVNAGDRQEKQLVDNMERLRWLPKSLGSRYVFVNQAAFRVDVFDAGRKVWTSKVIVGKPDTQTVVFNDEIEQVVFNPSWGVPPSIVASDYLPKLRNDPAYLDRIGFNVLDSGGQKIPSSAIDWWSYGNKVPFSIQQPPGGKNALGELKFLFPNAHNIYMHDTPSKELFDSDVRAFSHGCVRVQNPREFATVLLGWDRARVDRETASKRSQTVKLPVKVPIYLTYFTAWPDETGKVQYFKDIYGRDKALDEARSVLTVAQR